MYRQSILKEHISLIMEPESKFSALIAPTFGTCKCIEQAIGDFVLESKIPIEYSVADGCDGTKVNVGEYGGVISVLENSLDQPLQCMSIAYSYLSITYERIDLPILVDETY
ncbi:hypothetical protein AVEN_246441-1 [Araneus ventricosus]|uniref:Uncharacterized protein n=1 Tax=Araneus ventricosus TaxID=182803 RepID=A0A4Y2X1Z7_ARAVE|nr:hypothetical protein AVEN_246441-1 [Araneus ventricosus]